VKRASYSPPPTAPITKTAAQRAAEAEHRAKWARFKQLHNRRFSSPAVEQQRYAQFRANRIRIIAKNDAAGQGKAVYSSTSPFADLAPEVFRAKYLGARFDDDSTSLLEMQSRQLLTNGLEDVLFWQNGDTADEEVETQNIQLLEQQDRAEFDSDSGADEPHDSSSEEGVHSFASVSAVAHAPSCTVGTQSGQCVDVSTCRGTSYSGKCSGPANVKCCVPPTGPMPTPTPSPTPTPAPRPVSPTPSGPSCQVVNEPGVCIPISQCKSGIAYSGKCASPMNRCCLARMPMSPEEAAQHRTISGVLTVDYRQ
jgi:hypothetical protein